MKELDAVTEQFAPKKLSVELISNQSKSINFEVMFASSSVGVVSLWRVSLWLTRNALVW